MTAVFLLWAVSLTPALACSWVQLNMSKDMKDGKSLIFHTMEYGTVPESSNWDMIAYPHNSLLRHDPDTLSCTNSSYGFISLELNAPGNDHPSVSSGYGGMNEVGLTCSALSNYRAVYQKFKREPGVTTVFSGFLCNWLLGSFKDSQQVEDAIRSGKLLVWNNLPEITHTHFAITDSSGRSIVLEYENGQPMIYPNYVGVLTNDPMYPWQVENLNTYTHLSPLPNQNNINKEIIVDTGTLLPGKGFVPTNEGHGFNLGGLPGDPSPPSRFVRLFYLRQYAMLNNLPKTMTEWITLGQGILNNVFIVKGWVGPKTTGGLPSDHTPWGSMMYPTEKIFMYRTYTCMQWKKIDLKKIDFKTMKKPVKLGVLEEELCVKEITDVFRDPVEDASKVDLPQAKSRKLRTASQHINSDEAGLMQLDVAMPFAHGEQKEDGEDQDQAPPIVSANADEAPNGGEL